MSCPVTSGCFLAVRARTSGSTRSSPYGVVEMFSGVDDQDEWDELLEKVKVSSPSLDDQRLRAFFAVEYLCTDTIPSKLFGETGKYLVTKFRHQRLPQSSEGLSSLATLCHEALRELTIIRGEEEMLGEDPGVARNSVHLSWTGQLVLTTSEAADELRLRLRGHPKDMQAVGRKVGEALVIGRVPSHLVRVLCERMLCVTVDHPSHPWVYYGDRF